MSMTQVSVPQPCKYSQFIHNKNIIGRPKTGSVSPNLSETIIWHWVLVKVTKSLNPLPMRKMKKIFILVAFLTLYTLLISCILIGHNKFPKIVCEWIVSGQTVHKVPSVYFRGRRATKGTRGSTSRAPPPTWGSASSGWGSSSPASTVTWTRSGTTSPGPSGTLKYHWCSKNRYLHIQYNNLA